MRALGVIRSGNEVLPGLASGIYERYGMMYGEGAYLANDDELCQASLHNEACAYTAMVSRKRAGGGVDIIAARAKAIMSARASS